MQLNSDYAPEFDSLRDLLLELASERSIQLLLRRVVQEMAARPHAALAQLWLIDHGDLCAGCSMRPQCPDQTHCLHLVASAQSPALHNDLVPAQLARLPLGFGPIGAVAATGQPVVQSGAQGAFIDANGASLPPPAEIQGFDGQPIACHGETLGALVQFTRIPTPAQSPEWLRLFANHIGAAIVNARSFAEIEKLKTQLELENDFLREEVREARSFGAMIGQSAAFQRVLRQVEMVARTDATVLILGESGVGKELVARAIHQRSRRALRPLIRVNCASIPHELYESEFFGHVKGAFTGAVKDRAGRFEAAHGGALFLDEVGEIPLDLQGKFLRVLQEGQYERVGEERTRTVDVRLIAATNRDLPKDVQSGRFRQDLYYRLNVFPICVAPLRERPDDIAPLAIHFLAQAAAKLKLPPARLTPAHLAQLCAYDWPGNIRELQNSIERALILAQDGPLTFEFPRARTVVPSPPAPPATFVSASGVLTESDLRQRERENFLIALDQTRWKIHGPGGAAQLLGLKPTTLISRLKRLGLKRPAKPSPSFSR